MTLKKLTTSQRFAHVPPSIVNEVIGDLPQLKKFDLIDQPLL
jgi:hypothetical protein